MDVVMLKPKITYVERTTLAFERQKKCSLCVIKGNISDLYVRYTIDSYLLFSKLTTLYDKYD